MQEGIYLYCLTRSDCLTSIDGIDLAGQPLILNNFLNLTAVLSIVPLEEFCGPEAEARLQDISWVGPRACHHEKIIEQVMRHSPVLPARFGTIFSSINKLEDFLEKHHNAIWLFLEQMAEKQEWAVKGMLDRAKAKDKRLAAVLASQSAHLSSLTPGVRYFEEQRAKTTIEKELSCWLKQVFEEISSELHCYASDFCELKVLSRKAMGEDVLDMITNWAYLVPQNKVADFLSQVEKINAAYEQDGLVLHHSGPWPPYSFSPSLEL